MEAELARINSALQGSFQTWTAPPSEQVFEDIKSLKARLLELLETKSYEDEIRRWTLTRDVLETAFLATTLKQSIEDFQRAFEELTGLYFDAFVLANLQMSDRQPLIMALGLLYCLATDALDKYHILLRKVEGLQYKHTNKTMNDSTIESQQIRFFGSKLSDLSEKNVSYLTFPLNLGRHFMDGNITRVMAIASSSAEIPHPSFVWLVSKFVTTIRHHVALCLQASYSCVPVSYAMQSLALSDLRELKDFVEERTQLNEAAQEAMDLEGMKDLSESLIDLDHLHSMEQLPLSKTVVAPSSRGNLPMSLVTRLLEGTKSDRMVDESSVIQQQLLGRSSEYNLALFSSMASRPLMTMRWSLTDNDTILRFVNIRQSMMKQSKALALQKVAEYAAAYEAIV